MKFARKSRRATRRAQLKRSRRVRRRQQAGQAVAAPAAAAPAAAAPAAAASAASQTVELYLMDSGTAYTPVYSSNTTLLPIAAATGAVGGKIVFGSTTTVQFKQMVINALKAGTATAPASWSSPPLTGLVKKGLIEIEGCGGATVSCTAPPVGKPVTIRAANGKSANPTMPVPLAGLTFKGVKGTSFGTTPDAVGAVPPGAPEGTGKANIKITFMY